MDHQIHCWSKKWLEVETILTEYSRAGMCLYVIVTLCVTTEIINNMQNSTSSLSCTQGVFLQDIYTGNFFRYN